MKKNFEKTNKAIDRIGSTVLANLLTEKVGRRFTPSRVNNWRVRGVPWSIIGDFSELTMIPEKELKGEKLAVQGGDAN